MTSRDIFSSEEYEGNYYLCCNIPLNSMVAYIQSRDIDQYTTINTTQRLIGTNSLLAQYTSPEAIENAMQTYGKIKPRNQFKPNPNFGLTGSGTGNTDPTTPSNPSTNPSNPSDPGTNPSNPGTNPTPSGNIEISVAISPSADMGHVEGAGSYAEGEQVTLRAIPNSGYRFVWWQDNHDQNAERVITVGSENMSFTAVFGEII